LGGARFGGIEMDQRGTARSRVTLDPMELTISGLEAPTTERRAVEIVERKGLGHPDSLCDTLAEELSLALSRFYLEKFGLILHHNVDKVLLWGGAAEPAFGGGEVRKPIEIYLSGRATFEHRGITVPVAELAEVSSRRWLAANLHALDPARHVVIHTLVRPGSHDLVELYLRAAETGRWLANDTSIGVGYAPLSRLERCVLAVEQWLNSPEQRCCAPHIGEDVKVMGVRLGHRIELTVACAFVGRFVTDLADYARKKLALAAALSHEVANAAEGLDTSIALNAADDIEKGSVYLTVTGTSAEAGDDGQAGRGNRVNGLIAPYRPMTMESVAGKNPVTHVGKLYNIAAGLIAEKIIEALPAVASVEVYLVSRIGHPVAEPQRIELRIAAHDGQPPTDFSRELEAIVRDRLGRLGSLWRELLSGEVRFDRWPLRRGPA
jgi:S-adenosylmethionine synthetase